MFKTVEKTVTEREWVWKYTPEYLAVMDLKAMTADAVLALCRDHWREIKEAREGGVPISISQLGGRACAACGKWGGPEFVCCNKTCPLYNEAADKNRPCCNSLYHLFIADKTAENAEAVERYIESVRLKLSAPKVEVKKVESGPLPIPCRVRYKDTNCEGEGVVVCNGLALVLVMDTTRRGDSLWHPASSESQIFARETVGALNRPQCFRWFRRECLTPIPEEEQK